MQEELDKYLREVLKTASQDVMSAQIIILAAIARTFHGIYKIPLEDRGERALRELLAYHVDVILQAQTLLAPERWTPAAIGMAKAHVELLNHMIDSLYSLQQGDLPNGE